MSDQGPQDPPRGRRARGSVDPGPAYAGEQARGGYPPPQYPEMVPGQRGHPAPESSRAFREYPAPPGSQGRPAGDPGRDSGGPAPAARPAPGHGRRPSPGEPARVTDGQGRRGSHHPGPGGRVRRTGHHPGMGGPGWRVRQHAVMSAASPRVTGHGQAGAPLGPVPRLATPARFPRVRRPVTAVLPGQARRLVTAGLRRRAR